MKRVRNSQEKIFRKLYTEHKGTPMAVSSESSQHKKLRFNQIMKLFQDDNHFTVHDVGMGLGQLYAHLKKGLPDQDFSYSGSEILEEYVRECQESFPHLTFFNRDIAEKPGEEIYDYVVMSGVFHQRRDIAIPEWEKFSQKLICNSFRMAKKAIAFNFISPFVDFYQEQVYYCNLPKLLNFINDELSRFFVINHSYPLYEFTVFVYKEEFVHACNNFEEFEKYFKK